MRRIPVACVLLIAAVPLLSAEDFFGGTWKYDPGMSKSGFTEPGQAVKDETMTIQVTNGLMNVTILGVTEDGSKISLRYSTSSTGGPVNYVEGEPPVGTTVATRRISDRNMDFLTSENGKVVSTTHLTVTADGSTMRLVGKGLDEKKKHVHGVIVFRKQQ